MSNDKSNIKDLKRDYSANQEEDFSKEDKLASVYDKKFLDYIAGARKDIASIKTKRDELTAKMNERVASMVDKGCHRKAAKFALALADMEENERRHARMTMDIILEALGVNIQDDLFEAAAKRQAEQHQKQKTG